MLLERESALAHAAAALRRAEGGQGSLLVVRGPLGMGRSTFLESLADLGRSQAFVLLRAQASVTEERFRLGVVRQLVDSLRAVVPPDDMARWLRRADASLSGARSRTGRAHGTLTAAPPWSELGRQQASRWLAMLLCAMSDDRPVVLMVDDLQWADAESLRALTLSLARRARQRILFVFSVLPGDVRGARQLVADLLVPQRSGAEPGCGGGRPESGDGMSDRTLELAPLGLNSVRVLVEKALGSATDSVFVDTVAARSGGNPLLLRAVLDEAQYLRLRPTATDAVIAATLRPERVRQRLDAFLRSQPDHVRRTAYALTLLGSAADEQFVARLAELDDHGRAQAVDVLRLAGFMDPDSYRLASGSVLRDLLEENMPAQERTAMRGMTAELLHRTGRRAELAAEQLMAVMTLRGPRAVQILRTAADSAMRRGSSRDAARYLRPALLDSSVSGDDRARLLVDLATAERGFATAASLRHVVEAVPLLGSVRERADTMLLLGPLQMDPPAFRVDVIRASIADELRRSGSGDSAERELALRLEAREHVLSAQDPAHIQRALRRLHDLGPSPRLATTGERELVTSLMHIAFVAGAVPAHQLGSLCARILEREPSAPDHVHTTVPLAVNILAGAERTEGTASWLREANRQAQRRGGDVEQAVICCEQALVALADGHLATAQEKIIQVDALAGPESSDLPTVCAAILSIVAMHTDEPELAEQLLIQHRLHAENQHLAALLDMARGTLAARHGDPRTALEHYRSAGRRAEQIGWLNPVVLPWSSPAALMHHRLGEHEEALTAARLELERSRAWGSPTVLGRSLVTLGRVTTGHRGPTLLEEAVAVLEKGVNSYELCRGLYALGTHPAARRKQRADALKRAHDLANELDIHALAKRIGGKQTETTGESDTRGNKLTPSERKVSRLAAAGLSNSAIAQHLGTSSRMVEKHLTNSYRKLGISGRPGLATALKRADAER
ncbi:helix-turn-helix transcriptional regulator [Streptomyces corynorhini]|uniref:helix-turn-helix transcriptional regulator n=1 Tax=Streptomyces corynorhini TaxID=2282652 RepID=UPI001314423F|nr:LuxR family transcriptional regulator [Streptomyces corynorhini]